MQDIGSRYSAPGEAEEGVGHAGLAPKARNRRAFLRNSVATAALAAPAALAATPSRGLARPVPQHRLIGFAATLIQEVRDDEVQHVPILQSLLDD